MVKHSMLLRLLLVLCKNGFMYTEKWAILILVKPTKRDYKITS